MAELLEGNEFAVEIREALTGRVESLEERSPGFRPGLAIVQVGNNVGCNVKSKKSQEAAVDIGIVVKVIRLPKSTDLKYLSKTIEKLNADPDVHGILLLLPIGSIDEFEATNVILPRKDVEGVTTYNETLLRLGKLEKCIVPCTAAGCMKLIEKTGVNMKGKKAVVLGKRRVNGIPISELLKFKGGIVDNFDYKTEDNLEDKTKDADILVAALNRAEIVKRSWVKQGAVVIDCGFHMKGGGPAVGDVDFKDVSEVAGWISPVPGGMGPMIVAMLMKNTVDLAEKALNDLLNNGAAN